MARVKLNLRNLSVTDRIAKGRQIVTAMTNNARFATPNPLLSDVTTSLDDLERAFALIQTARSEVTTKTVTQDNAEAKLDQTLTQLAGYVESVAGKDDTVITSAGMETKSSASAPTIPTASPGLSATAGEHEGEINLTWKPVANARGCIIESVSIRP
jgi:hypothetical protein